MLPTRKALSCMSLAALYSVAKVGRQVLQALGNAFAHCIRSKAIMTEDEFAAYQVQFSSWEVWAHSTFVEHSIIILTVIQNVLPDTWRYCSPCKTICSHIKTDLITVLILGIDGAIFEFDWFEMINLIRRSTLQDLSTSTREGRQDVVYLQSQWWAIGLNSQNRILLFYYRHYDS